MPLESNFFHEWNDEVIQEKTLFEGFLTLKEQLIPTQDGFHPYYTIHTAPESVIILAVSSDNKLLLTREWRHAVKQHVLSFPGGLVEKEETPLETASRELLEETGYGASDYALLGTCLPLPGLLAQRMYIVMAKEAHFIQEPVLEGVESLSATMYPIEQAISLLRSSPDVDAMALAALSFYNF
jgi:ADP-ribose pyrophosphatase